MLHIANLYADISATLLYLRNTAYTWLLHSER